MKIHVKHGILLHLRGLPMFEIENSIVSNHSMIDFWLNANLRIGKLRRYSIFVISINGKNWRDNDNNWKMENLSTVMLNIMDTIFQVKSDRLELWIGLAQSLEMGSQVVENNSSRSFLDLCSIKYRLCPWYLAIK